MSHTTANSSPRDRRLAQQLQDFAAPDARRGALQLANSVLPFVLLWILMVYSLKISYVLTLLLALPAAGFLLRIFVLQHDLGHRSLFPSRRLNDIVGSLCSLLTMIPYYHWRRIHNIHHSDFGNLDRRGPGYVTTLTVEEYLAKSSFGRLAYRVYRHPLFLLGLGGPYYFIVQHRFAYEAKASWTKEVWSVRLTNLTLLLVGVLLATWLGWQTVLMVHLPILLIYSTVGVFIILTQHSFEDAYWERQENWDFVRTALEGSSYYQMPRLMQWFTANVGFHHVHHLRPDVPNHRLETCHHELPELQEVEPMTVRQSLQTVWMALWDEDSKRMIRFRDVTRRDVTRRDVARRKMTTTQES